MPISVNANEYKSVVGVSDLYVAEVTQDDSSAYEADTPEYLAPAAEVTHEPAVNRKTQYADDQPFDTMSSEGETTISLTVTGIPIEMLAKITGRVFDTASGRMFDNGGVPPYFALMFRSKKSNGSYRYFSYLKGRFDMPSEEAVTKADSPDPKNVKLTFIAIKTVYAFDLGDLDDGVKRVIGDEDTTNFSGTNWFTQVQTPEVTAISALAVSSSTPADDATGVSLTADLTVTFNNALLLGAEHHATLLQNNVPVAAAKSLSASKKVITVNPNASLDATTDYALVLSGVTDIYGQVLADTVITFTTAGS